MSMNSSIKNQEKFAAESAITEPHFDEEATLPSTRPVVPQERVESQVRTKRRLLLAGATTLAVLLGAVAALFLARLCEESAPEATFSSQTVAAQSNPGWQAENGSSAPAVADEPGAQQSHNLSATIEQGAASKLDSSHKTLVVRREERRARRLERETLADGRKRKKEALEGVFRTSEIFEGAGGRH